MLLLHHDPELKWIPWSDSHRRIAVYETAPVAAEAQGLEIGALTWTCTTSFRLRKAACRTNYTLRAMVSAAGLAPARVCLKGRTRELLCIRGRKYEMVPEVGIAPTSPRLQRSANLSQLLRVMACQPKPWRRLVVPRGNAPRSLAYQASALLLSYRTVLADGHHLRPATIGN